MSRRNIHDRTLDRTFLFRSIAIVLGIAVAVFGTHRFQVFRLANELLVEAKRSREAGNFGREARLLHSFLQLHPDQPDVLADLATAKDRSGTSVANMNSAINWYYRSLGHLPERNDLRARLAELLLKVGRVPEALQEAQTALEKDSQHVPSLRVQALARYQESHNTGSNLRLTAAASALELALNASPKDTEIASALVDTLDSLNQDGEDHADRQVTILDQHVAAAQSPESHALRARFRWQHGLSGVREDLQAAADLHPSDPATHLAIAQQSQRAGALELAIPAYQRVIELVPRDPQAYLGLGDCWLQTGKWNEATQTWNAGLNNSQAPPFDLLFRIADVELSQNHLDLAQETLVRAQTLLEEVPSLPENRIQRSEWRHAAQLLEGRWQMTQGEWARAESLLAPVAEENPVGSNTFAWEQRQRTALVALSQIYDKLERSEAAQQALSRLAIASPQEEVQAYLSASLSLAQHGELDRATQICDRIVHQHTTPADGWLLLATLQLERIAMQAPIDRNWNAFEETIRAYTPETSSRWKGSLLRAQAQVLQDRGQVANALAILENHAADWKYHAEAWKHIALFLARLGQTAPSQAAAQQYQTLANDPVDILLFRALLALQQDDPDGALRLLGQIPRGTQLSVAQQRSEGELQREIHAQRGEWEAEQTAHEKLVELEKTEPEFLRQRVLRGWEMSESGPGLEAAWKTMLTREGTRSPYVRVMQVRRWLRTNPSNTMEVPSEIKDNLDSLERDSADWPIRWALLGEIAEQQGNHLLAAQHFLRVAQTGYLTTYYRLQSLRNLLTEESWPAAIALLEATDWSQPAILVPIDSDYVPSPQAQLRRAFRQANQLVQHQADRPTSHRWLGMMQTLMTKYHVSTFEAPHAPALPNTQSPDSDDAILQVATQWSNLHGNEAATKPTSLPSPESISLFAAEQLRTQGESALALAAYQAWLDNHGSDDTSSAAPARWSVQLRFALLADAHDAADSNLGQMAWRAARQTEAAALMAGWLEQMIPSLGNPSEPSPPSGLPNTPPQPELESSAAENQLQRADTWEKEGHIVDAQREYEALLTQSPLYTYRAAYVRFLIRQQLWAEAGLQTTRMRAEQPSAWDTIWARAHLLAHEGQMAAALQELSTFREGLRKPAQDPLATAQDFVRLAELYGELGQPEFRKGTYRDLVERTPYQIPGLALALAQREEWDDATEMCLAALDTEHDYIGVVTLAKMAALPVPMHVLEDVILPRVEEKLPRYGDRPEFLFHVSNIRIRQLKTPDAIQLLRRVTDLDGNHVIAWNNLAALLAESPDTVEEAEKCIGRALAITQEPLVTVLDTRAVVHLHRSQLTEALELLERVTTSPEGDDPRYHFHLGWVHQLLGDTDAARAALERAEVLGIGTRYLTHLERQVLENLRSETRI